MEDAKLKTKTETMKQQTAVEWLVWQLNQIIDDIPLDKWDAISVIVKRAKQMEKEQIIKAWDNGHNDGWNTRENDYNPNYHKTGTGQEWYDYEFNYKYGQIKEK